MERREAIAEDLRALAEDFKSLLDSITTDPKERQRKERRWSALQGGIAILTSMFARRLATRAWGVLTGEEPPIKSRPASPPRSGPGSPADPSQAETISSSSSSVK